MILVQGFCPLKIKITQFPGGFRFNFSSYCTSTPGLSGNKIKGKNKGHLLGSGWSVVFFSESKGAEKQNKFHSLESLSA